MEASTSLDIAAGRAADWDDGQRAAQILRRARPLAGLPATELRSLCTDARLVTCAGGGVLFRQGDPAQTVYVLARGHVGLFLGRAGDYACLAGTAGTGDLLGEAGIFGATTYPVGAQAFAATELVTLPAASMRRLVSERFETVLALMGEMSLRIRRQIREIMDLKMKTATQRLAGHLAMLTAAREGPAEVRLPYEKKVLASQLGMQPETFSRALMKLQTLGVRNAGGAVFHLHDVALLRRYAKIWAASR